LKNVPFFYNCIFSRNDFSLILFCFYFFSWKHIASGIWFFGLKDVQSFRQKYDIFWLEGEGVSTTVQKRERADVVDKNLINKCPIKWMITDFFTEIFLAQNSRVLFLFHMIIVYSKKLRWKFLKMDVKINWIRNLKFHFRGYFNWIFLHFMCGRYQRKLRLMTDIERKNCVNKYLIQWKLRKMWPKRLKGCKTSFGLINCQLFDFSCLTEISQFEM
jgi:hypothetical protein